MQIRARIERIAGNHLSGWAVSLDSPGTVVLLHIEIDGRVVGTCEADKFRPDLARHGLGKGFGGFKFPIPSNYLDGNEHSFRLISQNGHRLGHASEKDLNAPIFQYSSGSQKPWRAAVDPTVPHTPEAHYSPAILEALHHFEVGEIDQGIALARPLFSKHRDLFIHDIGIVERVNRFRAVKSFRQIMYTRHRDWFRISNDSVWQSRLESKHQMRNFALRNRVPTPRLIARFESPRELLDMQLPGHYVAKPDGLASAKGVYAIAGGLNVFTGDRVGVEDIVESWEALNLTDPDLSFLIEEFIIDRFEPSGGVVPLDYKVYVFHGVAGFLEVFDRNHPQPSRTPYSLTWQRLPTPLEINSQMGPHLIMPDNLQEIVAAAETLGRDFGEFCRIDLFNSVSGPILGEITVLPGNGLNRTDYSDRLLQQAYIVFENERLWC